MNKLTFFLISGLLIFTAACNNGARTSQTAPVNTDVVQTQTPDPEETQEAQEDAQSELRRRQLNADIRAREQRNNIFNEGSAQNRNPDNIASEVRSKLEANIPRGSLTVEADEGGVVTVSGTVTNQQELAKIERLAKEIKGVTAVNVKATVAKPQT
ncbi:BON domain-containing protein [Fischerella thermalis]|uniref:Transporter n=1 Tax=Fischerella thermalis CCMEE 5268 TaxID=2019662 RepID=A0A2N6KGB7_9CYAN|nr:BON domain-containing protein [Fischerella thermalis]PLZ11830.1 transporter [Fischerella thermalis WC119]PLZ16334.1 transporter [Fischerella thermalis WC114]PLZ19097.1 transporter [Fischerella thermalis WC341]PLZ24262.1 transporter [Fischerella thermalis WC157]PLZ29693.1 transporter [Fischerella thermalis WC559]